MGIIWGLPTADRVNLVLARAEQTDTTFREMIQAREALFTGSKSFVTANSLMESTKALLEQLHERTWLVKNSVENRVLFLSLARSYIVRTFEPDATNILNAFSCIDPSIFDFFPDTFVYGLVFIFVYGAALAILSLLQLVTLVGDFGYYLTHNSELAVVYLSFRWICFYVNVLCAGAVYFISRLFFPKRLSLWAALFYLLMPSTLITTLVIKPHVLGSLFVLGMFYFCLHAINGKGKGTALFTASLLLGLAVGTVYVNVVFIVPLIIAGLYCVRQDKTPVISRASIPTWSIVTLPFAFVTVITGIYFFIYPNVFVEEVATAGRFYQLSGIKALGGSLVHFFRILDLYFGAPLVIVAMIGSIAWKKMRLFWAVCMAVIVILAIKFNEGPTSIRFYLPLVPLVIINALYVVQRVIERRGRLIGLAVLSLLMVYPASISLSEALHFKNDATEHATRLEAGRWINANIPRDSVIGLDTLPSNFRTPPFKFLNYSLAIGVTLNDLLETNIDIDYIIDTDIQACGPYAFNFPEKIKMIREFKHGSFLQRILSNKRIYGIADPTIRIYKMNASNQ
ncbi:MAG: glycosyltransferase family 39 protein [Candidatus Omnitrophica bacterium]|nr:glycosyltransferase family 39 protein [Candidatus Omnitrophota bacterium]